MTKKLKSHALRQHRIITQAALCVEDLLEETAKDGGRPWICVVEDHMKALFPKPRKAKPKKEIVYGLKHTSTCDHKFIDSNHCLKCGWRPE